MEWPSPLTRCLVSWSPSRKRTTTSRVALTNLLRLLCSPLTTSFLTATFSPLLWPPNLVSKDYHKLPGLLAGKTYEVPDSLRTEDYEARQLLAGFLNLRESSKLSSCIAYDIILKRSTHGPAYDFSDHYVKSIEHISNICTIPTAQTLITSAASHAKQFPFEIREKPVADTKPYNVRVTLREGSCFSVGLFDDEFVRKAENCFRIAPPPVHIYAAPFARPTAPARPPPAPLAPQRISTKAQLISFRGKGRGATSNFHGRGGNRGHFSFSGSSQQQFSRGNPRASRERSTLIGYSHPQW